MIYLDCPFDEKDQCKSLGGKWDPVEKKWYVPDGTDPIKFKKWLTNIKSEEINNHSSEKVIELSPSSLDYQISKCSRCFYLSKKLGIQTNNYPPPVFNKLDAIQKDFFLEKNTSFLNVNLPKGKFLSEADLPNKISSSILKDNKKRKFKLIGIPDLVIKPITKLAILQFDPYKIDKKIDKICNINFLMGYVELKSRPTNQLFERVTLALDILSLDTPPTLNQSCNDCNFFKKQIEL